MTAPTLDILVPVPSPTTWLVGAVVLAVLAVVTVLCVLRARRLDRLHRRTDAARAGLADALERRGTVALRVADALEVADASEVDAGRADLARTSGTLVRTRWTKVPLVAGSGPDKPALRVAARDALGACRAGLRASGAGLEPCEGAENSLTRRLAAVDRAVLPPGLAGELVDAEQLTVLARRVYNDAVRDTLDLRSRRLVRWLRLAGTAPVPAYFEIADPPRWTAPTPPTTAGDPVGLTSPTAG